MTKNDNKKLKEIIDLACEEAKRLGNTKVSPEHLFLGMLRMDQARAIDVLIALGVDFYEVKAKIEQKLNKQRDKSEEMPDELDLTLAANSIVKRVIEEAWKLGDEEVESEHLMLAMLRNQAGFVTKLFNSMGVDYEKFKEQLLKGDIYTEIIQYRGIRFSRPVLTIGIVHRFFVTCILVFIGFLSIVGLHTGFLLQQLFFKLLVIYSHRIKAAEEGSLDPIVGRDREIERLAQILSRRKKNNPVLIGEPGVGKSAIAEGLAIRIIRKKVSRVLFDKRVVALDIASIVAGTKYRGQFEERMKAILNELAKNKNIILFIDEIHTIVGAGGSGGSLDAANMLKPALSRGEIQCIGATTLDEYRQRISRKTVLWKDASRKYWSNRLLSMKRSKS